MKRHLVLAIILISFISYEIPAQIIIADKFQYRSHTFKGMTIPFRLFVPENYNSSQKYPLVLALHGSGERGNDNKAHVNNYRLATMWADSINQVKYPCFVVAPQCPSGGSWFTSFPVDRFPAALETEVVLDILAFLENEFNIDENRLYITGLSLGGYGTWDLIARYPDKFAAAIPMSGGGDVQSIPSLLHIPIWNFHGRLDTAVPISESTELLNLFDKYGRNVLYTHCSPVNCNGLADSTILLELTAGADLIHTEYQNGGHVIWNESYDYKYLLDWVFKQYKISSAVELTDPSYGQKLSGEIQIRWNSAVPDGFADIYFSDDAGIEWQLIAKNITNSGSYLWNTIVANDCAFGQFKIVLKDKDNIIRGYDNSEYFTINNTVNGFPFVKILNGHFIFPTDLNEDVFEMEMLLGDPDDEEIVLLLHYSPDGHNLILIDSLALNGFPNKLTLPVHLESLQNSRNGYFEVTVSNQAGSYTDRTYTFIKETPRETANPDKIEYLTKLFEVPFSVNIADRSLLKKHEYLLTFDDTTSSTIKYFNVYDLTESRSILLKETFLPGSESRIFDGLSFISEDVFTKANLSRSHWNTGVSKKLNFSMSRFLLNTNASYNGYAKPNDYKITFYNNIADTSTADTLYPVSVSNIFPARPVNFTILNLTTRIPVKFAYTSSGTITTTHSIWLLEELNGMKKRTWRVSIVDNEVNRTIPFGDTLYLYTYKGLSIYDSVKILPDLVKVNNEFIPGSFYLSQNYPNPFNTVTMIRFGVKESGRVNLEIFNSLGQRVHTLLNKNLDKGEYNISFNADKLASGIYLYRLESKGHIITKKMLLLK